MIIGITGHKRSGKDTTYQIIQQIYPYAERRAFADKLKQSAAALLGIPVEEIERLKTDPSYHLTVQHFNVFEYSPIAQMNVRTFLQRYGTEAHREVFGEDFWLEQCLPRDEMSNYLDHKKLIVVTDVRFDNEASWIIRMGGDIWSLNRDAVKDESDEHASEVPVDGDYVSVKIDNNGTLDDLYTKIETELEINGFHR